MLTSWTWVTICTIKTVDSICTINTGDSIRTINTGDSIRTINTGNSIRTINTGNSICTINTRDSIRTINTGDSICTINARDSIRTVSTWMAKDIRCKEGCGLTMYSRCSLVDIPGIVVQLAVECTMCTIIIGHCLTWSPQWCALLQRHVIQSESVVVCECS